MNLHEYQSKQIFHRFGIPIPRGRVASTSIEVRQIAEYLGGKVVVKAQVLTGGRGKAGGIRLAKSPEEAEDLASQIFRMEIKGYPVRKVLVDEVVSIDKEIYLGITNDRNLRQPVIIASSQGGVDIEEVAMRTPEKIIKLAIDPLLGMRSFQARDLAAAIDLPRQFWRPFISTGESLWQTFSDTDASLAEINPLVLTRDQRMVALDGKIVVDDNALFRHPDLVEHRDPDLEAAAEVEARRYGLSYIKLDGQIGCMVNGAGLAMMTMDIIKLYGGLPANFLDIGGGADARKVAAAFRIILSDPNVRVVLINIFGGITRCDEVAKGILSALDEVKPKIPMVARLVGTKAEEGRRLLSESSMIIVESLSEAAQEAINATIRGQK